MRMLLLLLLLLLLRMLLRRRRRLTILLDVELVMQQAILLETLLLDALLDFLNVSLSVLLTHCRLARSLARSFLPRTLGRPVTLETQPAAVTALGLDLVALLLPLLAHDAPRLDATYARLGGVGRIGVVRASTKASGSRAAIGRAPRTAWQAQTGAS